MDFFLFPLDECSELSSRVQKLRQQNAEHERGIATQKSKLEKFSEVNVAGVSRNLPPPPLLNLMPVPYFLAIFVAGGGVFLKGHTCFTGSPPIYMIKLCDWSILSILGFHYANMQ